MKRIINFSYSDFEQVKTIALAFPGAEESVSHENTPSVKVRGKLMCRLHESGEFIAIRIDFNLREKYLESYPEVFHLPDHYRNYPYMCMWKNSCPNALLKEVLELSWKSLASKKQLKDWEAQNETE